MTSKRFREIRVALKKDPQVFALDLGIGRIDLGAIENSLKSPRRKELEKLYRKFNVDMNYLIAGGGEMFLPNPITGNKREEFAELLGQSRTLLSSTGGNLSRVVSAV